MSEWKESKIHTLCEAIIDCVNKTAPTVEKVTPYRMIRTSNVKDGCIDLSSTNYVTEDIFTKWTRRSTLKKGDIVLTGEAPLGELGKIIDGKNLFLGQRLMMYRPNVNIVDPDFLFYAFLSREVKHQIKSCGMGSTVEHMRVADCSEIIVKHPDLGQQKEIGKTLSLLDAKIDNLKRQNETLEEIARSIFKHWFIDFEFPNPDGKPYKSSGGAMVRSDLGDIPEGWRVGKLGDVGKIITGKTPSTQSPELWGEDLPFITPTDFKNYGKYILGAERKISRLASTKFKNYIIPKNSIIVTCIGSDMGKVVKTAISCMTNQQINSIILFDKIYFHEYIFNYLKNQYKLLRNIALGGSTMPIINKTAFSDIEIIIPCSESLNIFENIISPLNDKIINNDSSIQILTKTRDALLPKLMSGQIRVKE
ncbi:restriction endonuclease subunit S [Chamaesiphon sp.]|uniref:restriction endonuclease subunit S n=1 Tax=Chamaesiphon sp. TaxID=2814140 RepID=UPI0035934D21